MSVNKIAAKLIKVMADCRYVQKCGYNTFHHYKYAMAADVLEKVNSSLVENGLAAIVTPELIEIKEVTTKKGDTERLATVRTTITLIDSESGETLQLIGLGSGQDAGDKAIMKAQTASIKYAWMLSLQMSTGDDPEADESVDERSCAETNGQSRKHAQKQSSKSVGKQAAPAASKPAEIEGKAKLSTRQIKQFYDMVDGSGASNDMAKMIIDNVLNDKLCIDVQTGKILWSNVSETDYVKLCTLFESGQWEAYFNKMIEAESA